MGWHYRMLGQATLGGPSLPEWRLERKLAAFLAFLSLEGATYRSRLVGLLWPDSPEVTARNNLSQLLRKIRLTTGADLITTGDLLTLSPGIEVDALTLRDLYAQGRYAELLELPGELLGGLNYDDCPELDDWIRAERERLLEWRVTALREEVRRLEQRAELDAGLERVRQWLDLDPVSEDAYRQAMKLHYLRGDRSTALRTYQKCCAVLREEFGTRPLPETTELAGQIERGGPPATTLSRKDLPLSVLRPPVLVGREREWALMEEAWASRVWIYLRGAPGSGKTRLAMDFVASKGATIVYGGRPGDQQVPFAASARNARTVVAQLPEPDIEPWVRREMARIVPELTLPGEDAPAPMASEQDVLRFRQASQRFFFAYTQHLPSVVVDDWQFYDYQSNLDGIYMWGTPLPSDLPGHMPRMVMTYRADEVDPASEALIIAQSETGVATIIDVEPLSGQHVQHLMDEVDIPADPATRSRLIEHSGGNPLFLLETIKHLIETDQLGDTLPERLPLPEKVWQLIEKRLGWLSPLALQAARAAATLQRDFDVTLVAEVLGAPLLDVAAAWDELEHAQIMRGSRFWHDLILEAVQSSIPASLQPILHRNAARALERQGGHPARIAQHWQSAGSPAEAIPNLLAAENQARAQFILDEAGAYRQQREQLLRDLGARDPEPQQAFPLPLTNPGFFGRDGELATVRDLIAHTPLLTLLGPGGVGKTRLSLEVGQAARLEFPDGVVFVPLAPISEAKRVIPQIARALGLPEHAPDLSGQIRQYLNPKRMLLLLDNFEQVLDSAPDVAALLRHAPGVRALVTSRAPLRVQHERLFPVNPLPLPRRGESRENPAVQLFVQRAQELRPSFVLNDENAYAISTIVHRLDGLPLALELAAARLRVLSPAALLARLVKALPLLSQGARDVPERQQTLRATVAWSDELLPEQDRWLFRHLAVFEGGWTIEAAEALTANSVNLDILESLSTLIDHSLVRVLEIPGGEPRYIMLATIREYALEQLSARNERRGAQERHAQFQLDFTRRARRGLDTHLQARWMSDLDTERENLRAAAQALLEQGCLDDAAELGWNLAVPRWILAQLPEGEALAQAVLDHPASDRLAPLSRAQAQGTLGIMRLWQHDPVTAEPLLASATEGFERGLDVEGAALTRTFQILAAAQLGDHARAAELGVTNALHLPRAGSFTQALALGVAGYLSLSQGDLTSSRHHYTQTVELAEASGDHLNAVRGHVMLAVSDLHENDHARAAHHLRQAYEHAQAVQYRNGLAIILETFTSLHLKRREYLLATRLLGASQALREAIHTPNWQGGPFPEPDIETELRAALGHARFDTERAEGRQLNVHDAIRAAAQTESGLRLG